MKAIIKFIILNSLRDKIYFAIFSLIIGAFFLAILLGSTMINEQQQSSVVFFAGYLRLIIIVGFIIFTCLTITKSIDNKEIEVIISKSISREKFILSYYFGFICCFLMIFLACFALIICFFQFNWLGLLAWSLSLILEACILISFAILTSLMLNKSFIAIFSSLAFYIISRMMGVFVLAIEIPQTIAQAKSSMLQILLKIISIAIPRLDLFTQSSWLINQFQDFYQLKIILLQSLIYIPLLTFMSFHDFRKKEF